MCVLVYRQNIYWLLHLLFQQMAGLVTDYMEAYGTKFAWKCAPKKVDKLPSGGFQVTWVNTSTKKEEQDTFDSVLWAVGESPKTEREEHNRCVPKKEEKHVDKHHQ